MNRNSHPSMATLALDKHTPQAYGREIKGV
jgi:hypothetical protein